MNRAGIHCTGLPWNSCQPLNDINLITNEPFNLRINQVLLTYRKRSFSFKIKKLYLVIIIPIANGMMEFLWRCLLLPSTYYIQHMK